MTATATLIPPAGAAPEPNLRFTVAGVPVVVSAASPTLADRLGDWLRRALPLTAGGAPGLPLRIEVRGADGGRPEVPAGAREVAALGHWRVQCDGDGLFTNFTHARCVVHLSAGSALLWLADDWWSEPLKLQQSPWLSTLTWLLRERNRFALHASAVARHGVGLLFAGASGSGKSSTALSLIHRGWDWLADDVTLFRPGATPRLYGLARGFSFHPALATRLPGLSGTASGDKRFALIDGGFSGRRVASCRPSALLLPRVTQAATSRLEHASPAAGLMELVPASGFMLAQGSAERAQAHMQALRDLLSAIPAYRLHAGRDVFGNGAALETLLAAHGLSDPG